MKLLGRLFFFIERQLCRIPGFMEAYGAASDAWSKQLNQRVERALQDEVPPEELYQLPPEKWDEYREFRRRYLAAHESPQVRAYWDRIRH